MAKDSDGNERTTDPIEFKVIPCNSPFVFPKVFMDSFSVYLGSSTKMALSSYTWSSDDGSCNPITVTIKGIGGTPTAALKLSKTVNWWQVEPTDYYAIQTLDFEIYISGIDGKGAAVSEKHGPYELKVVEQIECVKYL
jgi:hypothetical protein